MNPHEASLMLLSAASVFTAPLMTCLGLLAGLGLDVWATGSDEGCMGTLLGAGPTALACGMLHVLVAGHPAWLLVSGTAGDQPKYINMSKSELACVYAALILADEGADVSVSAGGTEQACKADWCCIYYTGSRRRMATSATQCCWLRAALEQRMRGSPLWEPADEQFRAAGAMGYAAGSAARPRLPLTAAAMGATCLCRLTTSAPS